MRIRYGERKMFDNGGAYDKMNIRKELPRYKKERDENGETIRVSDRFCDFDSINRRQFASLS
jgi:hypothetical protein